MTERTFLSGNSRNVLSYSPVNPAGVFTQDQALVGAGKAEAADAGDGRAEVVFSVGRVRAEEDALRAEIFDGPPNVPKRDHVRGGCVEIDVSEERPVGGDEDVESEKMGDDEGRLGVDGDEPDEGAGVLPGEEMDEEGKAVRRGEPGQGVHFGAVRGDAVEALVDLEDFEFPVIELRLEAGRRLFVGGIDPVGLDDPVRVETGHGRDFRVRPSVVDLPIHPSRQEGEEPVSGESETALALEPGDVRDGVFLGLVDRPWAKDDLVDPLLIQVPDDVGGGEKFPGRVRVPVNNHL